MRKLITSIVLAIVVLVAIVQFVPPLVFGKEHVKACRYRDYRSASGLQDRIPAIPGTVVALT